MKVTITFDTDKLDFTHIPEPVAFAGNKREQLMFVLSQAAGWLSEPRRGPGDWAPLDLTPSGPMVGSVFIAEDHPTRAKRKNQKGATV